MILKVVINYISHLVDFGAAKNGCDFGGFFHRHDVVSIIGIACSSGSSRLMMKTIHGLMMSMSGQGIHVGMRASVSVHQLLIDFTD